MELYVLLECLKWIFVGFELVRQLRHRNKEKALLKALESHEQRLNSLESKSEEIP